MEDKRKSTPLLRVNNVKKYFVSKNGKGKKIVQALNGISFSVYQGETFGLVGESGCGKTTIGRIVGGLLQPTEGQVFFDGQDITKMNKKQLKTVRREIQMVFQDPFASLDPRMTVGKIIEEPLVIHKIGNKVERKEKVLEMLEKVGLQPSYYNRYPHEFSGGQRQRIGIARALILKPRLVICDEPVSALDVSVQSQILNLLNDLQKELGLTYIFVAHGLNVVRHISDRVGVMYLGRMVEMISAQNLFEHPFHPYTKALLSANPMPDPSIPQDRIILEGDIPSPANPPSGCYFHTRCPKCREICKEQVPKMKQNGDEMVACHYPLEEE